MTGGQPQCRLWQNTLPVRSARTVQCSCSAMTVVPGSVSLTISAAGVVGRQIQVQAVLAVPPPRAVAPPRRFASGTFRNSRSGTMPSSGLPSGGSRMTSSSSSNVRQPSADCQKEAILAGSPVSMHRRWMGISMRGLCLAGTALSSDFVARCVPNA